MNLSFIRDDRMEAWLQQRAFDENVAYAEILRRALDREMVANPITTSDAVNDGTIAYFTERFRLREVGAALALNKPITQTTKEV